MNQSVAHKKFSLKNKLRAYLELMRPANIITAFADIIAGFTAAGGIIHWNVYPFQPEPMGLGWLMLATFGLYGGGVVFNDFFDADLDAEERPERAIPSGRASKAGAALLGLILYIIGVAAAFQVQFMSGLIALLVAFLTIVYDEWAKHSTFLGPLFMGLCRGGNLLLGVSIVPLALTQVWYLAFIPIIFIASITLVSQGEVHGGTRITGFSALGLISTVTIGLIILAFRPDYSIVTSLPFTILFGVMVLPPFYKAAKTPKSGLIKEAIHRGVLSLILLNAAITAGFAGIWLGAFVAVLLPISMSVSKLFSVT